MKESRILSVLAIFALLAIGAGNARADEDEDRAVQLIEEMGGKAIRDFKQPGEPVVRVEFHIRLYATFNRDDCIVAKRLGDADLKCLAGLKQLRVLSLVGSRVADDGLKTLADLKLPQLRELDLTDALVTDDGMKHLAKMKQLDKLTLTAKRPREDQTGSFPTPLPSGPSSGVVPASASETANSESKPEAAPWITDKGLESLAQLKHLQTLSLTGDKVTDAGLKHLAGLTELKSLTINCEGVTGTGLEAIAGLEQLEWLDLSVTAVTGGGLRHLSRMKKLQHVGLPRSAITDEGMRHLGRLTGLEELSLASDELTDNGLKCLRALNHLQKLYVSCPYVTDDGLRHLANLSELRELELSCCGATGTGLEHLARLKQLRILELGGEKWEEEHLKHLAALSGLRELRLDHFCTNASLHQLAELKGLEKLDLSSANLSYSIINMLQEALPKCKIIRPVSDPAETPKGTKPATPCCN